MIPVLNEDENIEELLQQHAFVILQFGTDTCQPCHAITHKLATWGTAHPNVAMRYIPLETNTEQAAQIESCKGETSVVNAYTG